MKLERQVGMQESWGNVPSWKESLLNAIREALRATANGGEQRIAVHNQQQLLMGVVQKIELYHREGIGDPTLIIFEVVNPDVAELGALL